MNKRVASFKELARGFASIALGLFVSVSTVSAFVFGKLILSASITTMLLGGFVLGNLGVSYWLSPYALIAAISCCSVNWLICTLRGSKGRETSWLLIGALTGVLAAIDLFLHEPPLCADSISSWWCVTMQGLYAANPLLVVSVAAFAGYLGGKVRLYLKNGLKG